MTGTIQTFCGIPTDRAVEVLTAVEPLFDDPEFQELIKKRMAVQAVRRAADVKMKAHKKYLNACATYQEAVTYAAAIKEEV